ncbi:MAG: hypothetical protein AAF390_21075 [Pseudomonadota bacterium]
MVDSGAAMAELENRGAAQYEGPADILWRIDGDLVTADGLALISRLAESRSAHLASTDDVRRVYGEVGRILREADPDGYAGLEAVSDELIGKLRLDFDLTPEDTLYRAMPAQFLTPDGTVSPDPDAAGLVRDSFNPVRTSPGPVAPRGVRDLRSGRYRAGQTGGGHFFGQEQSVAEGYRGPSDIVIDVSARELLRHAAAPGGEADLLKDAGGVASQGAVFMEFDAPIPYR